jgi:hypothetical protein
LILAARGGELKMDLLLLFLFQDALNFPKQTKGHGEYLFFTKMPWNSSTYSDVKHACRRTKG